MCRFHLFSEPRSGRTFKFCKGLRKVILKARACEEKQNQALPRQEAETEQADSSVDQNEDRQQDQVQLQEETLEENQAWPVNMRLCGSQHHNMRQELQLLD